MTNNIMKQTSVALLLMGALSASSARGTPVVGVGAPVAQGHDSLVQRSGGVVARSLNESIEGLKLGLTKSLEAEDHEALLGRKLTADCTLLGALTIAEIASGLEGDAAIALGFDYSSEPRICDEWPEDFRAAMTPLTPTLGVCTAFPMLTIAHASAAGEWPVAAAWLCAIDSESGFMQSRWHQPSLTQTRLDLPLSPTELIIQWTRRGAQVQSGALSHQESWRAEQPVLATRSDLYDFFSGLRAWHWCRDRTEVRPSHEASGDGHRVRGGLGEVCRTIIFERTSGGAPSAIEVTQKPIRILRRTPESFLIKRTVNQIDVDLSSSESMLPEETFIPSHPLDMFPQGARIRIELRRADRARGDILPLDADGSPAVVPERIRVWCGEVLVHEVRYGGFRRSGGPPSVYAKRDFDADLMGADILCAPAGDEFDVDEAIASQNAADLEVALQQSILHCQGLNLPTIYQFANARSVLDRASEMGASPALLGVARFHEAEARSGLPLGGLLTSYLGALVGERQDEALDCLQAIHQHPSASTAAVEFVRRAREVQLALERAASMAVQQ